MDLSPEQAARLSESKMRRLDRDYQACLQASFQASATTAPGLTVVDEAAAAAAAAVGEENEGREGALRDALAQARRAAVAMMMAGDRSVAAIDRHARSADTTTGDDDDGNSTAAAAGGGGGLAGAAAAGGTAAGHPYEGYGYEALGKAGEFPAIGVVAGEYGSDDAICSDGDDVDVWTAMPVEGAEVGGAGEVEEEQDEKEGGSRPAQPQAPAPDMIAPISPEAASNIKGIVAGMNIGKLGVPPSTQRLLDRFDAFVAQKKMERGGGADGFGEFVRAEQGNSGASAATDFGEWAATFPDDAGALKSRAKSRRKKKNSGKKKRSKKAKAKASRNAAASGKNAGQHEAAGAL
jgi:hypothetical protein